MIKCLPGKISFKLAGGLLVSSVSLWLAFFTGGTGLTINFNGSFIIAVLILIAPINISTCLLTQIMLVSFLWDVRKLCETRSGV